MTDFKKITEEEEHEISNFISLLQPIKLTYNQEMNSINWGLNKVESFIHSFEIPDPYKSNLLREVDQLRAYPFWEETVQAAFYLIADILEDYLKYIKRIEIESNEEFDIMNKVIQKKHGDLSNMKVLLLGSNCKGSKEILVSNEIRKIRKEFAHSSIQFIDAPYIKRVDIYEKISEFKPEIVHFSGHGTYKTGPLFNGDEFLINTPPPLIDQLIKVLKKGKKYIKLIIFNVCESLTIAKKVSEFIDYTIGIKAIGNDECVTAFSKGFYRTLLKKDSIKNAFDNGTTRFFLKHTNIKADGHSRPYKMFPKNPNSLGEFTETFRENIISNNIYPVPINPNKSDSVSIIDSKEEHKKIIRTLLKNYLIKYYYEVMNPPKNPETSTMVSFLIDKLEDLGDSQAKYFKDQNGSIKHTKIINTYFRGNVDNFKKKITSKEFDYEKQKRQLNILAGDLALVFYTYYEESLGNEKNYIRDIRIDYESEIRKYEFLQEDYNNDRFIHALDILEKNYKIIQQFGPKWETSDSLTEWKISNFQKLEEFVQKKSINYILRQLN